MTGMASNSLSGPFPGRNLAHVASAKGQIPDFASRHFAETFTDCDDLGPFSAAKFFLPDGFEFWIYKYEGTPAGTVEIFFESQLPNWEVRLSELLKFLAVSSEALIWKNAAYWNTP